MSYLIDTDWVIDHLNGDQAATSLLSSLTPSGLDLLIAATALTYQLTLITRNRDDYKDIPGLSFS